MDANHMARGGGAGKCCAHILYSGGEYVGDAATINVIIPSGKEGSLSSHNLHTALSPPLSERED